MPTKESLEGIVISGRGEGKKYIEVYRDRIKDKIGFYPYLGTLNLKVDEIPDLDYDVIRGFWDYGGVKLAPCKIKGVAAYVVVPEKSRYKNVLELLSSSNLRTTLNLNDGDSVRVDF